MGWGARVIVLVSLILFAACRSGLLEKGEQRANGNMVLSRVRVRALEHPREIVLLIGTQFNNLYTAVDTPAEAVCLLFASRLSIPRTASFAS